MKVLVSGGAGYIGSHTVLALIASGHDVVVVDDFANSKPTVIARLETLAGRPIPVHAFDLTDVDKTERLFDAERFDAVVHFAGFKAVGESVEKPLDYYTNNLGSTFSLLRAMARHDVRRLVFSSSATVYGDAPVPYREDHEPLTAANPYGWTKAMQEQVFRDVAPAHGLRIALLRYFNPVGAHESGEIGEDPTGIPNNLLPYIAQVAIGRLDKLGVFGDDYATPDGTCQRDYIHVVDLAEGHLKALDHLPKVEGYKAYNLGGGKGFSVLEMIKAFEQASGKQIPFEFKPRRDGDLPAFWADASLANKELDWRVTRGIDAMMRDTWNWQSKNPNGFE